MGRVQTRMQTRCGSLSLVEPVWCPQRPGLDVRSCYTKYLAEIERLYEEEQERKQQLVEEAVSVSKLAALKEGFKHPKAFAQETGKSAVKSAAYARNKTFAVLKSHPILSILFARLVDPFNRADRILVVVNGFVVMLSLGVAFFYSKSVQCCTQIVEYQGCPQNDAPASVGMTVIDCMG